MEYLFREFTDHSLITRTVQIDFLSMDIYFQTPVWATDRGIS